MFKKTEKGYYEFEEFKEFKGLIHGFSTRGFGDCNPKEEPENWKNIEKFLKVLELKKENLVLGEQVHGDKIRVVKKDDKGKVIPAVDGLLTEEAGVILGVKTADCLPILFYDPMAKVIGAAHAGWRGVLAKIPQKMIDVMIKMGCSPLNIIIGVGPYIGSCCYLINEERAKKFIHGFGNLKGMLAKRKKGFYLDMMVPVQTQLVNSGVNEVNIYSDSLCNSCHLDEFFSYRKDSAKTYGEILSVIGLTAGER